MSNAALSPQMHLPDEECSHCGIEFSACKIRSHQKECVKRKEKNKEDHQDCKGTKRKLASEMAKGKFPNTSSSSHEQQKAESISSGTEAKGAPVADEHGTIHQQDISIRYGSAKYSVLIEPERIMGKVMRKLAKMVGKQVDKLVFKVERSGKMITGEEIMRELVGEVIIVQNV